LQLRNVAHNTHWGMGQTWPAHNW